MSNKKPKPSYFWSILTMKCPRCRRGPMFKNSNAYNSLKLSKMMEMPDSCSVCNQKYDMETGFWFGTGYVSYGLAVAVSIATFVAWFVLIGVSTEDNRIFWWLGFNTVILIVAQPWLMRLSRVIYLRFFVSYDENYENTKPVVFD
jgi:uncharacterized protein (DUF983 family)